MKKKSAARRIKIALVSALAIYLTWFGYQLLQFNQAAAPFRSLPNELVGIFHVHSQFSDGAKNLDFISEAAAASGADFLILTDHGNLNLESIQASGHKSGILILGGSELSLNRGHLVTMNIPPPYYPLSHDAEKAAFQIFKKKGISVIAHPYSKNRWSWGETGYYSGMEIINADSMLKSSFPEIIPYLPFLLVKPEITAVKMLHSPRANLKKWDSINQRQPFYGYFAADAHMFYKTLFALLRLHIPLDRELEPDEKTAGAHIFSALQKGGFYNSIDAAAHASGFRFWGESGGQLIPMGTKARLETDTVLHIQLPQGAACSVQLIHNGDPIPLPAEIPIQFNVKSPGFYRVEVYLRHRFLSESCPWILSNPIYLEKRP
jgi:hypothetical protein